MIGLFLTFRRVPAAGKTTHGGAKSWAQFRDRPVVWRKRPMLVLVARGVTRDSIRWHQTKLLDYFFDWIIESSEPEKCQRQFDGYK